MADAIVELFKQYDTNGDGSIDPEELSAVMTEIGFTPEQCTEMFNLADSNKDGRIKYEEFIAWVFSDDAAAVAEAPAANPAEEAAAPAARESAAPLLKKAFGVMSAFIINMQMAAVEGGDLEGLMGQEEAALAEFRGLLEQSFGQHDASGEGVLDPEEAKVFFSHLVDEAGGFFDTITVLGTKKMLGAMMKAVLQQIEEAVAADPEMTQEMKAAMKMQVIMSMKEGMESQISEAKSHTAQMLDEYKANKAERDDAAFKVMDPEGQGTIQKAQFLEAFTPGSEKNFELMNALGITM